MGFKKQNKNEVGLDIDPNTLNSNDKREIYIGDLSKSWDNLTQNKIYGNLYYMFPNLNMFYEKYINKKFDTILAINSIHYILNETFMQYINKFSKKGTVFIIKFLDKSQLDLILDNYISYNSSFVRRINSNEIKIYYDWCHNIPIKETLYSKKDLDKIFNQFGWNNHVYNINSLDCEISDWQKYFKCFSTATFIKK